MIEKEKKWFMSLIRGILLLVMQANSCLLYTSTPPVGSVLFIGSAVSGVKMERVVKATLPFYICMIIVLMLLTFIPEAVSYTHLNRNKNTCRPDQCGRTGAGTSADRVRK